LPESEQRMIKELVLKELRDHLLSLRFQVGFLLAFVLVSAAAFVLSTQYQRETNELFERRRQEDAFLAQYSHLNRLGAMLRTSRPPSPLILVRGLPRGAGVETLNANPMLELFPPAGLDSIVGLVFSLLGIVLGFDALNGEKERGTLRLMLAHRLRRFALVAAKWAGGMLVLVVALAAAMLAALLIVLVRAGVHWSPDDVWSLVALAVVSLLYAGVFFSLALAFSTLSSRSSVSVLASLFAWVLLVFVVPNLSPYVAAQFARVPSIAALERDLQYITSEERDQIGDAESRKVREKYKVQYDFGGIAPAERKRRLETDPEFRRVYEQMSKEVEAVWAEVNRRQGEKADRLQEAWQARARSQFQLSRKLSYISPFPPFVFAATELSLTGFRSREQFEQQARAYDNALWTYAWARYHEEEKKNPAFNENDFLDVSTRPRFTYVPPRFSDRLADAMPFAGLLAAWNLFLFTVAVTAFLHFDVR
jgi:ABC-type transport system involved in multi-copper enzyme maturation permease subunit